jgi:pimeloyl-ACP methyl ester carboxylesterase
MSEGRAVALVGRLSPGDLGMNFSERRFVVRDSFSGGTLTLAAWWMPHPENTSRTIVLIHGYGDAKVGAIAWTPMLQSLGFNILAIDLRAHGESSGKFCTAGYFEREDINQTIDQLKAELPEQTRQIVLFGISLGGASAAAAALSRDDLAAVVLECPYVEFRHAVAIHANLTGMPGPWFVSGAMRAAEIMGACDFKAVRPIDAIPKIVCPLMVITSLDDPIVPPEDVEAIAAAMEARPKDRISIFWPVEGAWHVMALAQRPEEYRNRLAEFFATAMDSAEMDWMRLGVGAFRDTGNSAAR